MSRAPLPVILTTLITLLLLWLAHSLADLILLLFCAALFGVYLSSINDYLKYRFGLPRVAGLVVGILFTFFMLGALVWLIIPPALREVSEVAGMLPDLIHRWETEFRGLISKKPVLGRLLPPPGVNGYLGPVLEKVGGYVTDRLPYVFGGFHSIINIVSVVAMGIYLAQRPGLYRRGFLALVPPSGRDLAEKILREINLSLRAWLIGMFLAMIFLGLCTWVGLVLLGVPYALAFAVFTGVAVLVPFFGTIFSTFLPALFVLGTHGFVHSLFVILLGLVIHLVEANFIHPLVMEKKVKLPPVLSIFSVLAMGHLMGFLGIVVAIPMLALLMVLVRNLYVLPIAEGKGFDPSRWEE